ncbi:MAG: PIN domain-containing protein, partial [Phascolarctobacterium sp.]
VTIAATSHDEVKNALNKADFKDFEDCLQDLCAISVKADFLITDNIKDFSTASTKIISSEEFYKRFA